MKKSLLLLTFITFFLISCKQKPAIDYIVLSGKIKNPTSDSLSIYLKEDRVFKIDLKKDNSFVDTLNLKKGYYYISDGKKGITTYLNKGFNLRITFNARRFSKTIKFTGAGADENNYLLKKSLLEKKLRKLNSPKYFSSLNEVDFLTFADSISKVQNNLLNEFTGLTPHFYFIEKNSIEIKKTYNLSTYELIKQFTENKDFQISDDYTDPFDRIDFNDARLLEIPLFISLLERFYDNKTEQKLVENDSLDFAVTILKLLKGDLRNDKIKEELAFVVGKYGIEDTKELDEFYDTYMSIAKNEEYIKKVTEGYNLLNKSVNGEKTPIFELYDTKNNLFSLDSLKGKYVYIDVWATWSNPCLEEMPFLKEIKQEFYDKNIVFVDICKGSKKEDWEKMVTEKELGDYQLFAPDAEIDFFKKYLVRGVPRFILIDPEGIIVDNNASRPSDPKLKELLNELLK